MERKSNQQDINVMKKLIQKTLVVSLNLWGSILLVSGQITVVNTVQFRGERATTGTFNASGADKIVVVSTGEHGFNQTANGDGGEITFDGTLLTQAVDRNAIRPAAGPPVVLVDDTWNDIWYLDAADFPGGSFPDSELTISAAATTRASVTVIALSGTAPGVGNVSIGDRDDTSADLETTNGSIAIFSYGMGGSGNTAFVNNVTLDPEMTEVGRHNNGGGRWWDGHVVAYQLGVATETKTYSVVDSSPPGGDGRTGAHLIAAEFLAVGAVPGGVLAISDLSFNPAINEVTLTWSKSGASSYVISASTDLSDWDSNVDSGISELEDANPGDAGNITVTLTLPQDLQNQPKLFFRVEEEISVGF